MREVLFGVVQRLLYDRLMPQDCQAHAGHSCGHKEPTQAGDEDDGPESSCESEDQRMIVVPKRQRRQDICHCFYGVSNRVPE